VQVSRPNPHRVGHSSGCSAAVDRTYEHHRRSQTKHWPGLWRCVKPCPVTSPLWPIPVVSADGDRPAAAHGCAGTCTRSGKRRPECASANEFANETGRNGGDDARHRRRSARPSPGQRDEPERRRRGDVRRMAHNSRGRGFKSLPRYKGQRPFLEQRKGLLHVVCKRICARAPAGTVFCLCRPASL
jgi:hypothetical protein